MIKDNIADFEKYKEKFLRGESLVKIGSKYKVCPRRLGKALKEDGVAIRRNNQKYAYNLEFFDKIDSEEKAYWLGFLYADGYIGKSTAMELTVKAGDRAHLCKFRDHICADLPIADKIVTLKGKKYPACRLSFTSGIIKSQLCKLGCINRKTDTLRFSDTLCPTEYTPHFIRGYFDGDGCIVDCGFSLCGNCEFLRGLQRYIVKNAIGYTAVKILKDKRANVWKIQKLTPRAALKFLHFIYLNSHIHLDRKYVMYKKLSQHLPQRAEMRVRKSRKKPGRPAKNCRLIRGEGPQ